MEVIFIRKLKMNVTAKYDEIAVEEHYRLVKKWGY